MGLDVNGTRYLLRARELGVSFRATATLGRQQLLLQPEQLRRNLNEFGFDLSLSQVKGLFDSSDGFADDFLRLLGAHEVTTVDASDYEGANAIQDLNYPVPEHWKGRFSVVIDGGALEHVFNYPVALKSSLEMVEKNGHFLAITPTNNLSGHGFYQFSPELFFRVLVGGNGYDLREVLVYEETSVHNWYSVVDPDAVKQRVTFTNSEPSLLFVLAERTVITEVLQSPPQQSDYVSAWQTGSGSAAELIRPLANLPLRSFLLSPVYLFRAFRSGIRKMKAPFAKNSRFFSRIP